MPDFTTAELLAVAVSKELPPNGLGFIGLGTGGRSFVYAVGIPTVAIELAHRRGIDFIAQYGVMLEPLMEDLPARFSDPNLLRWRSKAQIPVETALDMFKRGMMDIGFISGAQVDPFGNTNTVSIGPHGEPKVRLVGGIAAPDHAAHADHTFILMEQEKRTFVPRVDFISALGHGDGTGTRERYRLRGKGPRRVFTNLAVLGFDEASKRMKVLSLHPGVDRADVEAKTAFELLWDDETRTTESPTAEEIALIREDIDPKQLLLTGGVF